MQLACDLSVASAYKSPSQRARVISETWFSQNIYCLACESNCVARTTPNTSATDFLCKTCGHRYELKTFTKRPPRSLVDGAYASLIARVNASTAPTLCLLGRSESWQVQSLIAIHSSFLTPWVIERRSPLSQNARRAGWVGCNIRLDRIPPDGEIAVISEGVCLPKSEVRRRFERFLPLANLSADQRGWTTLTLSIIRMLGRNKFALSDLYAREPQFAETYPGNRHVRAKIRQQLQVLRDLGVLTFEGRGQYLLLN
jgi:type II restriction enzyme